MVPLEQIQSTLIISCVLYVLIGYLFGAGETSKTALVASLKSKRNTLYKCLLAIGALGVIKLGYDQQMLPLNYYSMMEVGRHDSIIEIRKSYKTLSRTYHPDKNTASNAEEIFQSIKVAYDALMDETQRDIYNRFGPFNLEFDPRRDELRLIVDLLTVYVFWGVIAYIATIPAGARGSRTWITIVGILFMAVEVTFKLTESVLPDWMPKTMTEFELVYYLHSIFPVIIAVLRAIAESQYLDVDAASMSVLAEVWHHQKNVHELLQQFDLMLESTKKNINESNEPVQVSQVKEKIQSLKAELENRDDEYSKYIEDLKASTNSIGSNYYWVIFVFLYGGIYFFQ